MPKIYYPVRRLTGCEQVGNAIEGSEAARSRLKFLSDPKQVIPQSPIAKLGQVVTLNVNLSQLDFWTLQTSQ